MESLEMSGDIFFKAGENVTEVNFVTLFVHDSPFSPIEELIYLSNQNRFGEPVFQLIGFLWGTEKWRFAYPTSRSLYLDI